MRRLLDVICFALTAGSFLGFFLGLFLGEVPVVGSKFSQGIVPFLRGVVFRDNTLHTFEQCVVLGIELGTELGALTGVGAFIGLGAVLGTAPGTVGAVVVVVVGTWFGSFKLEFG